MAAKTFEERNSSLYGADVLKSEMNDVFVLCIAEGVCIPAQVSREGRWEMGKFVSRSIVSAHVLRRRSHFRVGLEYDSLSILPILGA